MSRPRLTLVLTGLLLVGWSSGCLLPAGEPDEELGRCDLGVRSSAVQAADRKILGLAAPYDASGALRGREAALAGSQRLRRELGWEIAAKVLAPVSLAEQLPAGSSVPGLPAQVPRWQTWYGRDDVGRLFHRLYEGLGSDGRAARARFSDAALDEALAWNPHAVEELGNWPQDRWQAYLEAVDTPLDVAGIGGIGRVGYSPSAARHLIGSYPDILACLAAGAPPGFVDTPGTSTRRMVREPVRVSPCEQRVLGPYFVGEGEVLRAAFAATPGPGSGAAEAEISVRAGIAAGAREEVCRAGAGEPCEVLGPGLFHVAADAGAAGLDTMLVVEYDEPRPAWAACLAGAFPLDSAVIKADWRRAQLGFTLPVYDTSAAALARRLSPYGPVAWAEPGADSDGDDDSGAGDSQADPGPEEIYTLALPNGSIYRLAGLHIMTKELDHWIWVTLWWSPAADQDFGADRPAAITALGGPWQNYKMCVVTAFAEEDPDPEGGFAATAPSLAQALAAVYPGQGGPSWCSNPYLELGRGNAGTNCIGCHQHGGTGLRAEDILADEQLFPQRGRTMIRNNFATDYSWAVDSGDHIGSLFADEAAYHDQAP